MLNWIAILIFMLLTALSARRLLLIWSRTRQLPELMIAILILGVGTVGVGLGFVIRSLVPLGTFRDLALFVPVFGVTAGMTALCVFTWQVYRPNSSVARWVTFGVAGALCAIMAPAIVSGRTDVLEVGTLSILNACVYVGVMLWSALEAFSYWNALCKRARLGLADPLVANRVLLWGIATGTAGWGIAIGMAARHFGGIIEYQNSWVTLCYAVHGFVAAVAFWLAFTPPASYVRWVSNRASSGREEAV